jgi:hypothetical protein
LSIAVLAVGIVALAVVSVNLAWNDRADDVCREKAPRTASGYSVAWEWSEFAYVCDYPGPAEQPRRVGIIEAFHGDGRPRHR